MVQLKTRLADITNRRFQIHHHAPEDIQQTSPDAAYVVERRTRYPATRRHPNDAPRLLIDGKNNVKLGTRIQKGEWLGYPLFSLTLEERATCSDDCFMKLDCYGNSMHMARRHIHGEALEDRLSEEIADKAAKHPEGFVVRLHVLGDFYSLAYALRWHDFMDAYPALHVFGYTHRHPWAEDENDAMIGSAIESIKHAHPNRFRVRWSSEKPMPDGATVIRRSFDGPIVPEGQICSTYITNEASCATCGMCWADSMRDRTIVFPLHGPLKYGAKGKGDSNIARRLQGRNERQYGRSKNAT